MLELWFFLSCVALCTQSTQNYFIPAVNGVMNRKKDSTDNPLGTCLCLQVKYTIQPL